MKYTEKINNYSDSCNGCLTSKQKSQCWFFDIKYLWISICPCSVCFLKTICKESCGIRSEWADKIMRNPHYLKKNGLKR